VLAVFACTTLAKLFIYLTANVKTMQNGVVSSDSSEDSEESLCEERIEEDECVETIIGSCKEGEVSILDFNV
jgi:hypothetical protein